MSNSAPDTPDTPNEQPAPETPIPPAAPVPPVQPVPETPGQPQPQPTPETPRPGDPVPGPDPSLAAGQQAERGQQGEPLVTPGQAGPQLPDPSVEQVNANHDDEVQRERDARQTDDVEEEETT